jgi:sterol desaturase/sphingolipid hydroxylase (fatty acid hydroxylase superfamily)
VPYAVIVGYMASAFFNHANIRLRLGPLTPILCGPQYHRIHHSRLPEHQDKNFAALFPVIDMMFGTYHRPSRDEFPPTGLISGAPAVARHWQAHLDPFRGPR